MVLTNFIIILKCRLRELHATQFQPYMFPLFADDKKYIWKSNPSKSCALGKRSAKVEFFIKSTSRPLCVRQLLFYFSPFR